jgi:hypothetical protein
MRGRPAGMRRVPINPPRGHDPEQHKVVGPVHSWDPPEEDGILYCSTGKPCTYPACAPAPCADRLLAHLEDLKEGLDQRMPK